VRRGHLSDHHIGERRQRAKPLLLGLLSVIVGLVVLAVAGAPRELVAAVVVMFVVGLLVTAVNLGWKISVHAAASAASITVLVLIFGPPLLVAYLMPAAVGWSRVQLRDHTTAQVLAGAAAGVVLSWLTFTWLR
jgi:membrane-associated phospholipid phosphatase